MKVVMISIAAREHVRNRTLKQLEMHNVVPEVFVNDLPLGLGNHFTNVIQALRSCQDDALFLEDDLDISERFSLAVEMCQSLPVYIVALYVPGKKFYTSRVRQLIDTNVETRLINLTNARKFFGSQALYLSRQAIGDILHDWNEPSFLDDRIAFVCSQKPGKLQAIIPNVAQHYGAQFASTWSNQGQAHRSIFYE